MRRKRPEYRPQDHAARLLGEFSREELDDKALVTKALKAGKCNLNPMSVGRVKARLIREITGGADPIANGVDPLVGVDTVLRILPKVGGLVGLRRAVSIIERVKERS